MPVWSGRCPHFQKEKCVVRAGPSALALTALPFSSWSFRSVENTSDPTALPWGGGGERQAPPASPRPDGGAWCPGPRDDCNESPGHHPTTTPQPPPTVVLEGKTLLPCEERPVRVGYHWPVICLVGPSQS